MGCTSSAPKMVNSSTAEKSIQLEEEMSDDQSKDTDEIIYRAGNDTNEITVLPSCDTLAEHNIHVVRNRSTPSFKSEKDNQENRHSSVVFNKTDSSNTLHEEENSPKLEQVVDKVVELYSSDHVKETQTVSKTEEESQRAQESNENINLKERHILKENEEHSDGEQDQQKDDHPEEAISPSQSESSRATRWEALADIAAELPPSLTVDPITGQIYALSK